MNTTLLLIEKWRAQKKLSLNAGHDVKRYAQLVDAIAKRLIKRYKQKKNVLFRE